MTNTQKKVMDIMVRMEAGTTTGKLMKAVERICAKRAAEKAAKSKTSFPSIAFQKKSNGTIGSSIAKKKYVSESYETCDFQAKYLVRDSKNEEPRGYYDIRKFDKETKKMRANPFDVKKMNLASLRFFNNLELMLDNIKKIGEYETLRFVQSEDKEIQGNEALLYEHYYAEFAGRQIVYTRSSETKQIIKVQSYLVYEAEWKARNKRKSLADKWDMILERYEANLNAQTDQDVGLRKEVEGSGVYSAGYVIAY